MNIIIAGCGKVGTSVVSSLVTEGHDVTVIDNNRKILAEVTDIYDVIGVFGNSVDSGILMEAGADKADLFVATTQSDELNMLTCFLAKKLGSKHTIARIRNIEYNQSSLEFVRQQLDLSSSINPEYLAAHEISNIIKFPAAAKIESFSRRAFEIVEITLRQNSMLHGLSLKEMRAKFKTKCLICSVQRNDEVTIPDGNFVLNSGDKIGIAATPANIQEFLTEIGYIQKRIKSVMILGGSKTAIYLAKMLEASGVSVKIIEQNLEVCHQLSEELPKSVIIHGDGAHQELLDEEGIASTDAFISLTGMDEENILISYYAASRGVPKVITKVSKDELFVMAEKLGLDSIITPKKIVADLIVRYARAIENTKGSNVETLYKLMDDKCEALEFKVQSGAKVTGIPLKYMKLKPMILIAGIIRGNQPITPTGDDIISLGDRVIIFSTDLHLNNLDDILR